MIRMGVVGADGRMGRTILHALRDPFLLTAAFVSPANPQLGHTVRETGLGPSDVTLSSAVHAQQEMGHCDVMLSFATPAADAFFAQVAADLGVPAVVGTTGHTASELERLNAAAQRIPLVLSSNFSLGIAVLQDLLPSITPLRGKFDASIVEVHHSRKRDAPSGTALGLADTLERILYGDLSPPISPGIRRIPITALRVGGVPGDHTVILAGAHEMLQIEHRVFSREAFAEGSLMAARWAVARNGPGLYSFLDVVRDADSTRGGSFA